MMTLAPGSSACTCRSVATILAILLPCWGACPSSAWASASSARSSMASRTRLTSRFASAVRQVGQCASWPTTSRMQASWKTWPQRVMARLPASAFSMHTEHSQSSSSHSRQWKALSKKRTEASRRSICLCILPTWSCISLHTLLRSWPTGRYRGTWPGSLARAAVAARLASSRFGGAFGAAASCAVKRPSSSGLCSPTRTSAAFGTRASPPSSSASGSSAAWRASFSSSMASSRLRSSGSLSAALASCTRARSSSACSSFRRRMAAEAAEHSPASASGPGL
mmetsp:Transcript_44423/g.141528  ORF Transcript_44423/g.141528 Transcript_44423/m.141528 type:complete len:281 (-) Transcript_44423:1259-2101(-)